MDMIDAMMNADLTPPPSIMVPAEVAPRTKEQLVAALDRGHYDHEHDPHLERAEEMPPRQLDDSMWLPAPDRAPWMSLSECRGTPLVMVHSTLGGE